MERQDRKLKHRLFVVNVLFLLLVCLSVFSSGWLAENIFNYETLEERVKTKSYEIPVAEIDTYICYTTQYGECYHASGCGSLWNSSYRTTEYEARKNGYRPCSRCELTEETYFIITETKQEDIHYFITVEHYPRTAVIIGCVSSLLAVYVVIILIFRRKIKKQGEEL